MHITRFFYGKRTGGSLETKTEGHMKAARTVQNFDGGLWRPAIADLMILGGLLLVSSGWRRIHSAGGALVTNGIYGRMRHPQYTGILLMTFGMLLQWPTLLTLGTWPILLLSYYRLARTEERLMESQFGDAYRQYRHRVAMFIPCPLSAILRARITQKEFSLR